MTITKNEQLLNYINDVIETKELNISVADMLLYAFNCKDLIDPSMFSYLTKEEGLLEKDAIIRLMMEAFEMDLENEENQYVIQNYLQEIHEENYQEYINNPYIKSIKPKQSKNGKYSLKYCSYEKYQLFPLDEISLVEPNYLEVSKIGYFKKKYDYLALLENDTIWMCITPNEMNTMKPAIEKAKGRVLVLGLGLGYYPFMISLKDDVEEIVVVEKDKRIIDIFNANIAPNIRNSKITVVNDDAYSYLEKNNNFDMVFADLWHNPEDGITHYVKLKKLENKINKPFSYWLEPSLIQMFRRCIITILQEYFEGYTQDNYLFAESDIDKLINEIYKVVKDMQINSIEDVKNILSDEFILTTISSKNFFE